MRIRRREAFARLHSWHREGDTSKCPLGQRDKSVPCTRAELSSAPQARVSPQDEVHGPKPDAGPVWLRSLQPPHPQTGRRTVGPRAGGAELRSGKMRKLWGRARQCDHTGALAEGWPAAWTRHLAKQGPQDTGTGAGTVLTVTCTGRGPCSRNQSTSSLHTGGSSSWHSRRGWTSPPL